MKFSSREYFAFTAHAAFGSGFRAWIRVLYKNKFQIHPYFLPKVIFITCAIFLGIPFRWYEKIKYKKSISQQRIVQPVFIIGHPRSGTTFLHYLLSKDKQFAFCTTMQAMLPHIYLSESGFLRNLISKALPALRPMDNLKMGIDYPKEEEFAMASFGPESMISGFYFPNNYIENFRENVLYKKHPKAEQNWKSNFNYFLRKLTFSNTGKRLLLKSPANTGRIKQILELYPDAKFIHIHRNPLEVYSSTMHLFEKMLPMLSFQNVKKATLEESIMVCYEELYKKYLDEKSMIPAQNLFEIGYSNFIENPLACLERIYSNLKLDGFTEAIPEMQKEMNEYKNYESNKFLLEEKKKQELIKRWKFAFESLGY